MMGERMTSIKPTKQQSVSSDKLCLETVNFRSHCPVARTLDVLGDKWTLVIMRDALVFGARTYADFASQVERIPTNLLAQRLQRLVDLGMLAKVKYQAKPPRYEYVPTPQGKALKPMLREARKFGEAYLADEHAKSP